MSDDELDWAREERLWRERGRYTEAADSGGMTGAASCNGEAEPWGAAETAFAEVEAEADAQCSDAASREVTFEVVGWRHALAGARAPSTPVPSPYTMYEKHVCTYACMCVP
eukprot:COSAG03_NODE_8343_length_811_cov_1.233146_2_plen_110_part_01